MVWCVTLSMLLLKAEPTPNPNAGRAATTMASAIDGMLSKLKT